jgi:RNA-directed DNA polymerase
MTRLVEFRRPDRYPPQGGSEGPRTFDLLAFTHHWGKARSGKWVVKRRTSKDRFRRVLKRVAEWCREHLHDELRAQQTTLGQKLRGHFGYYGIIGNGKALLRCSHAVEGCGCKWLNRRWQRASMP